MFHRLGQVLRRARSAGLADRGAQPALALGGAPGKAREGGALAGDEIVEQAQKTLVQGARLIFGQLGQDRAGFRPDHGAETVGEGVVAAGALPPARPPAVLEVERDGLTDGDGRGGFGRLRGGDGQPVDRSAEGLRVKPGDVFRADFDRRGPITLRTT